MKVLSPLIVVVLILGIGFAVAFSRRGVARTARPTSRSRSIDVALAPEQAFERIAAMPRGTYRVDDHDRDRRTIVLSSNPTGFTWGFLYPVFVTPTSGGGSRVEVGIRSRFIQVGPLVTGAHDRVMAAIEEQLRSSGT